jgi:hypothetical protein
MQMKNPIEQADCFAHASACDVNCFVGFPGNGDTSRSPGPICPNSSPLRDPSLRRAERARPGRPQCGIEKLAWREARPAAMSSRSIRLKPAIATCLIALVSSNAQAWNNYGHMLVAAIAYEDLKATPLVRAKVDALIKLNPQYKTWINGVAAPQVGASAFLMASRWPDAIKHASDYVDDGKDRGETPVEPVASQNIGYKDHSRHKYWHYKDVGFSTDGTPVLPAKIPNVSTTIVRFRATLASTTASVDLKSYDLSWLTHLVGDVHQPLHATSRFTSDHQHGDIGGNTVALCAAPCKDDLHAFWDDVLGKDDNPAAAIAAAKLIPPAPSAIARITDVETWVKESFVAAKADAYVAPIGPDGHGPYLLDDNYRSHAKGVAEQRVALAGARLANLIRTALK